MSKIFERCLNCLTTQKTLGPGVYKVDQGKQKSTTGSLLMHSQPQKKKVVKGLGVKVSNIEARIKKKRHIRKTKHTKKKKHTKKR